ncbi:hypothetical protein JZ751_029827 [Albula glossodonta]|uniref:Uncharacterized protein n=1 Tax=Albula glossodonta TaxID=121402 RepID=A0A8T2N9R8_9TELE|nr:hypothetical protein JZ751_029827 [Albula glossodonta]
MISKSSEPEMKQTASQKRDPRPQACHWFKKTNVQSMIADHHGYLDTNINQYKLQSSNSGAPLTGPVKVHVAKSLQPPFCSTTHLSMGAHEYPSPEYAERQSSQAMPAEPGWHWHSPVPPFPSLHCPRLLHGASRPPGHTTPHRHSQRGTHSTLTHSRWQPALLRWWRWPYGEKGNKSSLNTE